MKEKELAVKTVKLLERYVRANFKNSIDTKNRNELRIAVVMLAPAIIGSSKASAICQFTDYPKNFVQSVVDRLVIGKLFTLDGGIQYTWAGYSDPIMYYTGFLLDFCVADGSFCRRFSEDGEALYQGNVLSEFQNRQ